MAFQPIVQQELLVDGVAYRVAEHPAAPGMPYGQEGRQATVYQLVAGRERRALKVFKPQYRIPTAVTLAERMTPFARLPGLGVCRRTVLTPQQHAPLLRQHPDLVYAVLMPWIAGPTWMEALSDGHPLSPDTALVLAHTLAEILTNLEQNGLAHCDLSAPNLLLAMLAPGAGISLSSRLALVDVEQICGPGLDRPAALPAGSMGYAHATIRQGYWAPDADRFAGGVLLAEILGWCAPQVCAAAWGESYFEPGEMQHPSARAGTLATQLTATWGTAPATLFERMWSSTTLAACPTFGEWLVALPDSPPAHIVTAAATVIAPLPPLAPAPPSQPAAAPPRANSNPSGIPTAGPIATRLPAPDLTPAAPRGWQQLQTGPLATPAQSLQPAAPLPTSALPPTTAPPPAQLELDRFFDSGLTAYIAHDWVKAQRIFAEIVRQQPDYAYKGTLVASLLQIAEREIGKPRRERLWLVAVVALLLLIIVLVGSFVSLS